MEGTKREGKTKGEVKASRDENSKTEWSSEDGTLAIVVETF